MGSETATAIRTPLLLPGRMSFRAEYRAQQFAADQIDWMICTSASLEHFHSRCGVQNIERNGFLDEKTTRASFVQLLSKP
jgi:hypothetical protein